MNFNIATIYTDANLLYKKANSNIRIYTTLATCFGTLLGYFLANLLFIEFFFDKSSSYSRSNNHSSYFYTILGILFGIIGGFYFCKFFKRNKSDTLFFILFLCFAVGMLGFYCDAAMQSPSKSSSYGGYGGYSSPAYDYSNLGRQLFCLLGACVFGIGFGLMGFKLGEQKALFLKLQVQMMLYQIKQTEQKLEEKNSKDEEDFPQSSRLSYQERKLKEEKKETEE